MNQSTVTVHGIADSVWGYLLDRDPYLRLRSGLRVDQLRHGSLNEAEEDAAFARGQIEALGSVDEAQLDTDDWLSFRFLHEYLAQVAEAAESWWWSFPVTPYGIFTLNVVAGQVVGAFDLRDPSDVDSYVSIAHDYALAVRTAHDKVRRQAERGWRVPLPALPGCVATVEGMLVMAQDWFGSRGVDRAERLLASEVQPALNDLRGELNDQVNQAPNGVGLSQYPGGEEAYRRLVCRHATYNVTVEAVHETGREEIKRLTEELRDVRAGLGFVGSEAEFRRTLEAENRLYASSTEDVESRYRRAIERLEPELGRVFAVTPKAKYDIKRLDPAMEAGLTYGFYEAPTDAVPIGFYNYNGSGLATRSQLNAAAIIYHELVPGHHYQIARQKENTKLPAVRQEAAGFGAFVEGWAEYAAGVANELGMYADPYDKYGWIIHQRFVAQRLVIDTGMNALGWPLEEARQFMSEMTFESTQQVATDTLRYSTDLPGQALGYRLGHLRFLELRERARSVLGSAFDIKDFHELVLAPGALPLSLVEEHLERHLAESEPSGGQLRP
jgi:uncharacterized protein (DUF885 family)